MEPADYLKDLYKTAPKQETNYGFIVSLVVLFLILGGWYYFTIMEKKKPKIDPSSNPSSPILEEALPDPSIKRWTLKPYV